FRVFFDIHSHEFIKFGKDLIFEKSSLDGVEDFTTSSRRASKSSSKISSMTSMLKHVSSLE
ncbi:hypothetical protein Tco_0043145, partial [Tanacetum coccineum]